MIRYEYETLNWPEAVSVVGTIGYPDAVDKFNSKLADFGLRGFKIAATNNTRIVFVREIPDD